MTMVRYRVYELDPADRIVDDFTVICRSDASALAMARACAHVASVEVWAGERQVARVDPPPLGTGCGTNGSVIRNFILSHAPADPDP